MGAIIAGLAIGAVGAGVSAYGTSQNASATRDQAKLNAYLENKFGKKWMGNAEELISDKEEKLYDIANIFDRFEGAGAFGDTDTLENLRQAQSDFAALAAGDYSGFESQLRQAMDSNLINSFGTGAPIGSYAELSANTLMDLRRTGLSEAEGITSLLSNLSNELLGIEFGVMDQGFNLKYGIDRARLDGVTGNSMAAAQTAGVATQAAGGAITSIGSSITSYGMYQNNLDYRNSLINNGGMTRPTQGAYGFDPRLASTSSPYYSAPILPAAPNYNYGNVDLPVDSFGLDSGPGVLPSYPGDTLGPAAPPMYPSGSTFGWVPATPAPAGSLSYGYGNSSPFASLAGVGFDIARR